MTKLITIDYEKYMRLVNPEEKAGKELEELKSKFDERVHKKTIENACKIRKQAEEYFKDEYKGFKRNLARRIKACMLANSVFGYISITKLNKEIERILENEN